MVLNFNSSLAISVLKLTNQIHHFELSCKIMLEFYLFLPYISKAEEETFPAVVILPYDIQNHLKTGIWG